MESTAVKLDNKRSLQSWFSPLVILLTIAIGFFIYTFILGDCSHFQACPEGVTDCVCTDNHPMPGDYFAIVYKGGVIIPFAIGLFLMMIVFSIERFITISKATGKSSIDVFVKKIQLHLNNNQIEEAIALCDQQRGSIANVTKAALEKYHEMSGEKSLDREQKVVAIQKEIEEATTLELPMLERNLVIIATIVSIGTLIGLIGTVLGMIKAFSALATAGSPDAVALANGISEALVNTALGITTSTIATIAYNYFTSSIDALTYRIDESGFSIVQTFASRHNTSGEAIK
ncbi:MAG: MotA/TolQ/ExbB proton channel family protein [Sphingobacteriia bacterium]|nr:MotA/TolQ/ExbB proton channel family protein [Sphingobacteriia bacterium]